MIGGFAVTVDWAGPVDPQRHDRMVDVDSNRDLGHVASYTDDGVVLSEFGGNPAAGSVASIAVDGGHAIVGDIVLWNTAALQDLAGGTAAALLDDRGLLLAAYRRVGLAFLDDLYGEYAFVIWDANERLLIAVRDHIGVRPLFFTSSPQCLRLASRPKQLIVGSETSPAPDPRMVSEHLTGRHRDSALSFFRGVQRVPPAHVLVSRRRAACAPSGIGTPAIHRFPHPVPGTWSRAFGPARRLGGTTGGGISWGHRSPERRSRQRECHRIGPHLGRWSSALCPGLDHVGGVP